jgi:hypothetical protein
MMMLDDDEWCQWILFVAMLAVWPVFCVEYGWCCCVEVVPHSTAKNIFLVENVGERWRTLSADFFQLFRDPQHHPFIASEGTKLIWVIPNLEGTSQIFSEDDSTKNSAKHRVFHDSSTASELL